MGDGQGQKAMLKLFQSQLLIGKTNTGKHSTPSQASHVPLALGHSAIDCNCSKLLLFNLTAPLICQPQLHRTTIRRPFKAESAQFASNTMYLLLFRAFLFGGGAAAAYTAVKAEEIGSVGQVHFFDPLTGFRLV